MKNPTLEQIRLSHEARSFVNRENGLAGVAARKAKGYPTKRRSVYRVGMGGQKGVKILTADYAVLHAYAEQERRYMTDVLHDLIGTLEPKLEKDILF